MKESRGNSVSPQRTALTEVKVVTVECRGVLKRASILFPRWSEYWGVNVPIRKLPRSVRTAITDEGRLVVAEINPKARNVWELNPKNYREVVV